MNQSKYKLLSSKGYIFNVDLKTSKFEHTIIVTFHRVYINNVVVAKVTQNETCTEYVIQGLLYKNKHHNRMHLIVEYLKHLGCTADNSNLQKFIDWENRK